MALRPRLATGVLFRGGRPDERGQSRVHVRRIRRIRSAIPSGYRHLVLDPQAKGYELPIRTPLDARKPPAIAHLAVGSVTEKRCVTPPRTLAHDGERCAALVASDQTMRLERSASISSYIASCIWRRMLRS